LESSVRLPAQATLIINQSSLFSLEYDLAAAGSTTGSASAANQFTFSEDAW
jgi:hypothetical protein